MAVASQRTNTSAWAIAGIIMGLIGGVTFAMFEMIVAEMQGNGFFMPLRMIGAIALGEEALQSDYSLVTAGVVGLVVHMALSAVFGLVFGVIAGAVAALRASALVLIVSATIFGFLLWIVNFYVIAPAAFPWFENADTMVQFIAHTFFFGTVLGLLLAWRPGPEGAA